MYEAAPWLGCDHRAGRVLPKCVRPGGHDYATVSPGPAWDFELKPRAYRVQGTVNRVACEPVVVKVVKGTVQDIDIVCPNE